jgi:regulator of protease activity HflC (stomatin/prohibitin superfamily)
MDFGTIMSIVGLVILVLFLSSTVVITQQKTSKIITMFGKFVKTTTPGLSFKLPFPFMKVDGIIGLEIRETKGEVTVKSSDNAFLTIPWALQYKVKPSSVKEAYYELDSPKEQMTSYILNTLRGEASNLTMEQLFQSNASFESAVNETLSSRFEQYGYEIINVLVDDPQPSDELKNAFDEVIASKREKEAAQNKADSVRIKMIGAAEAEGESLKIKARAFKIFRKEIAEGNSEAVELFLQNMDDSLKAKDVLDFFAGVDLRDAIRDSSKNAGNMVVVPVDFQNNITLPTTK